jgi:hypothetical protein
MQCHTCDFIAGCGHRNECGAFIHRYGAVIFMKNNNGNEYVSHTHHDLNNLK